MHHNQRTESLSEKESILLTEASAVRVLATGIIHEQGLLPYSSNHSFLVTVTSNGSIPVAAPDNAYNESDRDSGSGLNGSKASAIDNGIILPAVYKPQRGENPLWDFEWGSLCKRETAAYEISRLLSWQLVPPTVLRNGPHGIGSVQLYIDNDDEEHYFTVQADARYASAFRKMALFDYVINNADRKSGHCLVGHDEQIWAIDHGVCFHEEYKLRTVIWEFSGMPIDEQLLDDLMRLHAQLDDKKSEAAQTIRRLLSPVETRTVQKRIAELLYTGRFPSPDVYRRNFPWPPI